MATTTAACAPAKMTNAVFNIGNKTQKRTDKVVYIRGPSSHAGLKAHNSVVSLGMPVSTKQCFANVVRSIKASANGKVERGGALASKCSKVAEILQIAAVMNGLVLAGVAVGFVLLQVEAFVEESASSAFFFCQSYEI